MQYFNENKKTKLNCKENINEKMVHFKVKYFSVIEKGNINDKNLKEVS